jgi:hypothetical protein
MTEQEWLAATDPMPMLEFLRRKVSDRKLRLFAVACCRRLWHLLPHELSRNAVDVAERLADGFATSAEQRAAALARPVGGGGWSFGAAVCTAGEPAIHAVMSVGDAQLLATAGTPSHLQGERNPVWTRAVYDEAGRQVPLLRDIIGNPFRPVTLDPAWVTSTVTALARGMYESRDFCAMPILADALQDAGCDNQDILNHCRDGGPHVRGCWVVDLVLGKQ